ncbi:IclR family transcriptional regulator [Caldibacillus lycopersici]|uniref:Glycerol operon regulatory protein n=1 Tax=Perspicuibacillus lycopersici TaxID=1325689 RepID=A0AAE3LM16_9BACI|nr:IclR family transcriptional regulator [Perspicuibacillus lycopersici]
MKQEKSSVQSVERALTILELLKENLSGLGITEIARDLAISKSTVHRLIQSLEKFGFVKQDVQTSKYLLGLKLVEFSDVILNSLDIRAVARPYLDEVAHEIKETIHLVVVENDELVYIDKMESPHSIRMYSRIGRRAPFYCTGVGKAILAYLPDCDKNRIMEKESFKKYTEYTITSKEELQQHLQDIQLRGYSIDNQEHELGIRCVAAPIFNHENRVIAGISITAPIYRFPTSMIEPIAKKVIYCANQISSSLGHYQNN